MTRAVSGFSGSASQLASAVRRPVEFTPAGGDILASADPGWRGTRLDFLLYGIVSPTASTCVFGDAVAVVDHGLGNRQRSRLDAVVSRQFGRQLFPAAGIVAASGAWRRPHAVLELRLRLVVHLPLDRGAILRLPSSPRPGSQAEICRSSPYTGMRAAVRPAFPSRRGCSWSWIPRRRAARRTAGAPPPKRARRRLRCVCWRKTPAAGSSPFCRIGSNL